MSNRPRNIILIMADNHPANLLGCYGNTEVHTPNIDRLAQQSVQFNHAYCVNAMCSPCRASVLTGQMPSQHGIHTWIDDRKMETWPDNWNALTEITTLPELLAEQGYDTALIGKYHLGDPSKAQNGFNHWVTFPHGHTRSFWGNTVIENGTRSVYEGHIVDFFAEKAVDYLNDDARQDNPFFLFLPFNSPYGHWPSIKGEAQNRFAHLYADCPCKTAPREGISKAVIDRYMLRVNESGDGLDYSAVMRIPNDLPSIRNYFSQMSMLDDAVGRVLGAMEANGLADDTVVVYTCDHGFSLGHHGFWGHAQATWPSNAHGAGYHIPLLISGSDCVSRQTDNLISQVDLFPTLLGVAGIADVPENAGRDMSGVLADERPDVWDEVVYIEQEETRAVRTDKWLYMKRFQGNARFELMDELYDLNADPNERNNLAGDNRYVATVAMLDGILTDFFEQHSDPKFDLWRGGVAKSNSDKPWFWQGAWGEEWAAIFS